MKKFFAIFLMLGLFATAADAQSLLKGLGEKAIQSATQGAKNAVNKQVTKRAEAKAENAVNNAINNIFGEIKRDTITDDAVEGINNLTEAMSGLGAATAAYSNALQSGLAAGANIELKDYSEENAAREERNKSLVFDKWDY